MKRTYSEGYDDCINGKIAVKGASRDYYNGYGDACALMVCQDAS